MSGRWSQPVLWARQLRRMLTVWGASAAGASVARAGSAAVAPEQRAQHPQRRLPGRAAPAAGDDRHLHRALATVTPASAMLMQPSKCLAEGGPCWRMALIAHQENAEVHCLLYKVFYEEDCSDRGRALCAGPQEHG